MPVRMLFQEFLLLDVLLVMSRLRRLPNRSGSSRCVVFHRRRLQHVSSLVWTVVLLIVSVLLLLPSHVWAQGSPQDTHAVPLLPAMIARGDAGVARPDLHVASMVNPAQLGLDWGGGLRVTVLGLSASGRPGRVTDAIQFFEDDLSEVETLTDEEVDRVEEEALDLFDRPLTLRSAVLLPSVAFRAGTAGISVGAFVTQTARGQAIPQVLSPDVAVFGQTDGIIAVGAGLPLGDTGARVGATGRYVRRYVSTYRQAVEIFDVPPVLSASTVALDLGAQYDVSSVEGLTLGVALYDLLGGEMSYDQDDFFGAFEDAPEPGSVERAQAILDDFDGPRVRLGAAYTIPRRYLPRLGDTAVLLDWTSASSTSNQQSVLRKLRLGTETNVRFLQVRAGLSQGLPAAGIGLNFRVLHLDYAVYGRQEGVLPEDGASFAHVIQLRVGW